MNYVLEAPTSIGTDQATDHPDLELILNSGSVTEERILYSECRILNDEEIEKNLLFMQGANVGVKRLHIKNGYRTISRKRGKKTKFGKLSQKIQICVAIFFNAPNVLGQRAMSEKVIEVRMTKKGNIIVETISSFHHLWLKN